MAIDKIKLLAWLHEHRRDLYLELAHYTNTKGTPYKYTLVEEYLKEYHPEVYTQWILMK